MAESVDEEEEEDEEEAVDDEEEEDEEAEDDLEAELVTEAEGLQLHLSSKSKTGYLGVRIPSSGRFVAAYSHGTQKTWVGTFDTALEAAVAYARHVKAVSEEAVAGGGDEEEQAANQDDDQDEVSERERALNAREAAVEQREAAVEAELSRREAALETRQRAMEADLARREAAFEARRRASAASEEVEQVDEGAGILVTTHEAELVTEAEGLRLHLSRRSPTGYLGVKVKQSGGYEAKRCHANRKSYVGTFDTALEAAVAYARHVKAVSEEAAAEEAETAVEDVASTVAASRSTRPASLRPGVVSGFRFHPSRRAVEPTTTRRSEIMTQAEGFDLYMSLNGNYGYEGVRPVYSFMSDEHWKRHERSGFSEGSDWGGNQRRFEARFTANGTHTSLGIFDTAVEAAVAYARHRKMEDDHEAEADENDNDEVHGRESKRRCA